jgi:hypothetical protein
MREHRTADQTGFVSLDTRVPPPRKSKVNDFCTLGTWSFEAADSTMINGEFPGHPLY